MESIPSSITPINIEDEMRDSYMEYAMSVIVGRALPDVRDGLKPVHRRVLFAMHDQGNHFNRPYRKSARVVGDVIGKYHPHGESAVYDTSVRMAQDFSMRYPLVDGQGNFGSVDGDPPAAMRYTEVRMTRLAHELLSDIEAETVDFAPNYDGYEMQPTVLPSRFPNLLVNGSGGIAVGTAGTVAVGTGVAGTRVAVAMAAAGRSRKRSRSDCTAARGMSIALVQGTSAPWGALRRGSRMACQEAPSSQANRRTKRM